MTSGTGRPLRGLVLFAGAVMMFACLDATSKYLARSFPVPFLAWVRYLVHFALMTVVLAPRMGRSLVRTARPIAQIVRGLLLVSVTVLMMAAFRRMPLAEATAVVFASPLLVTVLARPLLDETIGKVRAVAVIVGFVGVWVIARPGTGLDPIGTACALTASITYALYQVSTRALARTESAVTLLYYTAIAGSVTLTIAAPWMLALRDVRTPTALEDVLLVCLGVFGGTGHFLLTLAFREAPASLLSPLVYSQLVWAGLLGFVIFGDVPPASAIVGVAIVAGAGLLLAWEGRRLAIAESDG